jgi:excisionase family DNA binding protein
MIDMPITRDFLTIPEAAEELGVDPSTLRHAARKGTLKAELLRPRLLAVTREELDRYKREHHGKQGWDKRNTADYTPSPMAAWAKSYRARKRRTATVGEASAEHNP